MKKCFLILLPLFAFLQCREIIELDIPNTEPRIVIDGLITNQPGPYSVKLSKSAKYSFQYNIVDQPSISNALVILKDDLGNIDTLAESSQGVYHTDSSGIVGIIGCSYAIEIYTSEDGNWISNFEKMYPIPKIDSIYFERDKTDVSEDNPGYYKYSVFVDWNDPIDEQNYYLRNVSYYWSDKWHTNINWNWVFSDKYFNGQHVQKSLLQEDYGGKPFKIRLRQYSLTPDCYKFWNLVHEQTQLTDEFVTNSSIPLYGNVYNIDQPDEFALGYFQVSAVDEAIVNINR